MLLSSPVTEDPLWGLWPRFKNEICLVHFWHSADPFEAFSFCLGLLLWKCTVFPLKDSLKHYIQCPTAILYSNKLTCLCCIYCTIYSEDLHCVAIHLQNFRMFLNQGLGVMFGIKGHSYSLIPRPFLPVQGSLSCIFRFASVTSWLSRCVCMGSAVRVCEWTVTY